MSKILKLVKYGHVIYRWIEFPFLVLKIRMKKGQNQIFGSIMAKKLQKVSKNAMSWLDFFSEFIS